MIKCMILSDAHNGHFAWYAQKGAPDKQGGVRLVAVPVEAWCDGLREHEAMALILDSQEGVLRPALDLQAPPGEPPFTFMGVYGAGMERGEVWNALEPRLQKLHYWTGKRRAPDSATNDQEDDTL